LSPPAGTARHALPRYRFGDFVLSPRQRVLAKAGREQSLIPRYFDLLVLLVERRHEAVHRREIFDLVWHDVIVSDGALSQAMRTLRRTLGDDSSARCRGTATGLSSRKYPRKPTRVPCWRSSPM
jgi:DNA-binding winged helix-turn-helix (wHTH) protein